MFFAWTRRLQRTVGLRVALWYAIVFAVSVAVFVGISYVLLARSLQARDREIVVASLRTYADIYARGGLGAVADAVEREQRTGSRERLFVRVVSYRGDAVFLTIPDAWRSFAVDRLGRGGEDDWLVAPADDQPSTLEVASARLPDGAVLQVGKSTESRDDLLARVRRVLLLVTGLVLATGLVGGIVLTQSAMQPVRRLTDAVRTIISTGRTDVRVETVASGDPLDELGVLVNAMLERITRLVQSTQDSLDNVAHDLRTPLARLRVRAEQALATDDPHVRTEALEGCIDDADRITAMLDTLMDIAEARSGVMGLQVAPIDVAALLRDVFDLYADVAEEQGLVLHTTVEEGITLEADLVRLRRALANLVDNAVKYTEAGGHVTLSASAGPSDVRFDVVDTGAGIEAEELAHIWERLYRGDRSRSSKGLGLGLSLVRALVEAHGGTVEVESTPGRGSRFTIRLPRRTRPPSLTQM
jgi:signal transduction histidine kinase